MSRQLRHQMDARCPKLTQLDEAHFRLSQLLFTGDQVYRVGDKLSSAQIDELINQCALTLKLEGGAP